MATSTKVFTPVEGGTFTGEGYSLTVDAGAVPNGEFLGIRMSDEGAASNLGMTHQRYTLGGNMYAISAVDSSQATISSYVLDDPGHGLRAAPGRVAVEHLRPCAGSDQQRWLADDPRRSGADQIRRQHRVWCIEQPACLRGSR